MYIQNKYSLAIIFKLGKNLTSNLYLNKWISTKNSKGGLILLLLKKRQIKAKWKDATSAAQYLLEKGISGIRDR